MASSEAVLRKKNDSVIAVKERFASKKPGSLGPEHLCRQARWIRDVLDPQVAQDGQDALHSDEILTLDQLLRELQEADLRLEDIRYSRIHLAICAVAGTATRWPKKLIDRCDAIRDMWEAKYGPLSQIGTLLYEPGGRLDGVCKPEDTTNEKLLVKWLMSPDLKLSPAVARRSGDLGFTPGDWWIHPLFAHRAGIIDSPSSYGGIVSDAGGVYAIVMTGCNEVGGTDPDSFQYRARDGDPRRYHLTAATPGSRRPIRILRSHSLHSPWKPRAGLRYDGLHLVTGWSWKKDKESDETVCIISFKRLTSEVNMQTVLSRPRTDEVEDYTEFKRLRHQCRLQQQLPVARNRPTVPEISATEVPEGPDRSDSSG